MPTEPGIYEAKRSTRWDSYPQDEPAVLVRVVSDGPFVKIFHADGARAGAKCVEPMILIRRVGT